MAITGTFQAMTATKQPMASKPAPVARHGEMTQPDNNWSAPPNSTGGGYPDAEGGAAAQMDARGIRLDIGHEAGHAGRASTRVARRPYTGRGSQLAAQEASAAAHGDPMTGYYQGHQYDPMPEQTAGAAYTVSPNNVRAIPSFGARTVIHGRPGGQFSDGQGGEFAPTGFPIGEAGRWAAAHYSSPTLGAMYSTNALRGVLPQTVATPYNQPALDGPAGTKAAGIPSNQRFLGVPFTTPALFRSPTSESDAIIAAAPAPPTYSDTMGVGL